MSQKGKDRSEVDEFLRDQIDSVPHLEALLLLWNSRPKPWSGEEMAERLFVSQDVAEEVLGDLVRKRIIGIVPQQPGSYRYDPEPAKDQLFASVDSTYRQELIRVSRLIHSKPSAAVREFARAFRLKSERE